MSNHNFSAVHHQRLLFRADGADADSLWRRGFSLQSYEALFPLRPRLQPIWPKERPMPTEIDAELAGQDVP